MKTENIVLGVIGMGMGKLHLKGAIACGAKVGGICDTNRESMENAARELKIEGDKLFEDYNDLLAVKEINTVIIASPDQLHREMAVKALEMGKHVMCEKPLALNRADIDAIISAANKSDKKFMVGQICRFTPGFLKAKEIVDSGAIGEVYFMESEYAHDYVNILKPGNWRCDNERNGVVGGGCHAVDLVRWFMGDPCEVFSYGTHKVLPTVTYDDANIAIMKFPNGTMGKVFVSTGCKRDYTMRTVIYGTKGTIICDNTSPYLQLFKLEGDEVKVAKYPEQVRVNINNHNAQGEFEVFAKHITEDTPVKMNGIEGAKTVEVCFAIVESAKSGKPVAPIYSF
ncbi:MAG: Gfo/Idh/MocA family oxidoreductase [Ruminococcaceae bacterium]|nr:Gfo/Idh/MocA family oxidoreductase [Oscillospiraceae bacterium]